jgi:hypothetical protein
MKKNIWNLPYDTVLNIYKEKLIAEEDNNFILLKNLEQQYPELFTNEFEHFISNLTDSINCINVLTGNDFSHLLKPFKKAISAVN